jgi:hypothetical protein
MLQEKQVTDHKSLQINTGAKICNEIWPNQTQQPVKYIVPHDRLRFIPRKIKFIYEQSTVNIILNCGKTEFSSKTRNKLRMLIFYHFHSI